MYISSRTVAPCVCLLNTADVSQPEFENIAAQKLSIKEKVQHHLDKHALIGVGVLTHVYHIDRGRVRKLPAPDSGELNLAIKSI